MFQGGNTGRSGVAGRKLCRTAFAAMMMTSGLATFGMAAPVQAQETKRSFDIPAQPLATALTAFGQQSGLQVSAQAPLVEGKTSNAVRGAYSRLQALSELLTGTGLSFRIVGSTVTLQSAPQASEGAISLGPVRVEGKTADSAHDSSRDPGVTEGSGSYTGRVVTIGKTPTSLRETPQSVSVVTRQRIEDQHFTDLGDAFRYTTGLNLDFPGTVGTAAQAMARGAYVDFQIDGVNRYVGTLGDPVDLALFDRIEVLRGPAGLFKGAGSPGATINLVRKRALASFQLGMAAGVSSWGGWRGEADVTGSLDALGRARGRFALVAENRGDWRDYVKNRKLVGYGTVEVDIADSITLSAGGTLQNVETSNFFGLPTYEDGHFLDVPRSTSFATEWTGGTFKGRDAFLEVEHRGSNNAVLKMTLRHTTTANPVPQLFPNTAGGDLGSRGVDANGMLDLWVSDQQYDGKATSGDAFFSMPFALGTQTHNFLIGADFIRNAQDSISYFDAALAYRVNIFALDRSALPYVQPPLSSDTRNRSNSYGIYSQLRVKPASAITLIGGARVSWYETKTIDRIADTTVPGEEAQGRFTPYGAVLIDITSAISLYASYGEIFRPQSALTFAGKTLPPVIGSQYEAGIKGTLHDAALNFYIAAFRITETNRAIPDPEHSNFSIAAGKTRSQGFEAEISGALTPHWNLAAGYTYTETRYLRDPFQMGQAFSPITPKHLFNLWSNYSFMDGPFSGFDFGVGVRVVGKVYIPSNPRVERPSYATASAAIGYRIDKHFKASLNLENLFDKHYIERIGSLGSGSFFGAPRSFMLTLRAAY